MRHFFTGVFILSLIVSIYGCQKNPSASAGSEQNSNQDIPAGEAAAGDFKPFYVYTNKGSRLNHYVPSGFMPNGKCLKLNDSYDENCYSEKTCIRIEYDLECSRNDERWAGIYWLNPANNWGKKPGGGFDLKGAQRLTFWARGENGGEQIKEFFIGGISDDYPDSDSVTIGPVILTKEWRQYTIDLRGRNLSYISGGFAWSTSEDANNGSCTFYLDEIRYE